MSTTLYPVSTTASTTSLPTPFPVPTSPAYCMAALTSRGTAAQSSGQLTAAGLTEPIVDFISPPLAADVTISGSITFNLCGYENNLRANVGLGCAVYRFDATTGLLTQIVSSDKGTELGTSEAAQNWSATPTSTTLRKGDRLVIRPRFGPVGTEAGGYAVYIVYSGPAAGASGDSYVTFTETLTFDTADPTGTVLYPTDGAATDLTTDDDRLLAVNRGAAATTATTNAGGGPINPTQVLRSGVPVRWYTPPLAAGTLVGPVKANIRWACSSNGSYSAFVVQLVRRTSGGAETTLGYAVSPAPVSTAEAAYAVVIGIADTAISSGDRLGLLVYTDDSYYGNHVAGTDTFYYNGPTASASGDSWLQFNSTIAFAPSGNTYTQSLSASLSFSVVQTRQTNRGLTAGLSPAGSVSRTTSRSLSAALTPGGSLSRMARRTLGAVLAFGGSLAASRMYARALTATLGMAGSVSRSTQRALSATLAPAGALGPRVIAHQLSAALGMSGGLARSTLRSFAASLSSSAALAAKSVRSVVFNATLGFAGAVSRRVQRPMAATLSPSGSLARQTRRAIAAGLTGTGSLARSTARSLTASLSFAGALAKTTQRTFSASLGLAGSLVQGLLRRGKALLGLLHPSGASMTLGRPGDAALTLTAVGKAPVTISTPTGADLALSGDEADIEVS